MLWQGQHERTWLQVPGNLREQKGEQQELMACDCGSDRIMRVSGKTDDTCFVRFKDREHNGYVPSDLGIGGGDYIRVRICLECGTVQDTSFPITDEEVVEALEQA